MRPIPHATLFPYHKTVVTASWVAGCLYCKRLFWPSQITEWWDVTAAVCPVCGTDEVIGSAGFDSLKEFLQMLLPGHDFLVLYTTGPYHVFKDNLGKTLIVKNLSKDQSAFYLAHRLTHDELTSFALEHEEVTVFETAFGFAKLSKHQSLDAAMSAAHLLLGQSAIKWKKTDIEAPESLKNSWVCVCLDCKQFHWPLTIDTYAATNDKNEKIGVCPNCESTRLTGVTAHNLTDTIRLVLNDE